MPIKEKATTQIVIKALESQTLASGAAEVSGAIIDCAGYDNGVYFAVDADNVASGATATLKLEHGDNALLSDAALVPSDNLVYGTLPVISADISEGEAMPKEGVFGTKRYLKASLVKAGAGTIRASVAAIVNPEIAKTPQDSL